MEQPEGGERRHRAPPWPAARGSGWRGARPRRRRVERPTSEVVASSVPTSPACAHAHEQGVDRRRLGSTAAQRGRTSDWSARWLCHGAIAPERVPKIVPRNGSRDAFPTGNFFGAFSLVMAFGNPSGKSSGNPWEPSGTPGGLEERRGQGRRPRGWRSPGRRSATRRRSRSRRRARRRT